MDDRTPEPATRGWGAVLSGGPDDLEVWKQALKAGFDGYPWTEVHDGKTILRSARLDELASSEDVRDGAIALIERLNGALALAEQTKPVRFGGVMEFDPDGRRHQHVFAEGFLVSASARLRGAGVVTGSDGRPVPPSPPKPSLVQRWVARAETDELLQDALIYFGRITSWYIPEARQAEATDWFDVYKCLECLKKRHGGERAFLELNWAPREKVKLLKQTADRARHAKRVRPPPQGTKPEPPMDFSTAKTLLGKLLRRASDVPPQATRAAKER
jgi:hypothetical protein